MGTGAHPDGGAQPVLDSLSALQQVAGHCPRSAESLLRDGHNNGSVSAAVTTVAPTISFLTWVKCPASMLRNGHYNDSVSAAVKTVHMQSFRRGHRLPRVVRCATAASAVASQLPLQRCFCSHAFTSMLAHTPCDSPSAHFKRSCGPMPSPGGVVTARRPLQRSRLSCRFSGASTAL